MRVHAVSATLLVGLACLLGSPAPVQAALPICGAKYPTLDPVTGLAFTFAGASPNVAFSYPAPWSASGTISTWDIVTEAGVSLKFIYHINGNVFNIKGKNIRDVYDMGSFNASASAALAATLPAGYPTWLKESYTNGLRSDSVAGYKPGKTPSMPAPAQKAFPANLPGPKYACGLGKPRSITLSYVCGASPANLNIINVVEVTPCVFTADVVTPMACPCGSPLCTCPADVTCPANCSSCYTSTVCTACNLGSTLTGTTCV